MAIQPGTIIERYVIESVLGRGGMAEVYAARHTQLGSLHALKILTNPSADVRDRLLTEGRVQANLRHPNIVNVTDVVHYMGSPGLVMEYIAGPTLGDMLNKTRFALPLADRLVRGILNGVAAAHEHGLIHRDLKPANILMDIIDGELVPKVADFGLVKVLSGEHALDHSMTRSGVAMGTPAFMAPEQIRDTKNVDLRADLFSLGAILYEIVTGQRAFQGADMMDIFTAIVSGDMTPTHKTTSDLPTRMADAIQWALQVDLEERVPSCKVLLETWCEGPSYAYPWSTQELVWPKDTLAIAKAHRPMGDLKSSLTPPPSIGENESGQFSSAKDIRANTFIAEGQAMATAHEPPTAQMPPPPNLGAQTSQGTRVPSLDSTLSPEPLEIEPFRAQTNKRSTAPMIGAILLIAAVLVGGWWWTSQVAPPPAPTQGQRFAPLAPTSGQPPESAIGPIPATVILETKPSPSPSPSPPTGVPPAEPPTGAPPIPPSAEPSTASPPIDTTPETAPPPERAPTTARFSWTGTVDSVRLRDAAGNLFGPGEIQPGSYSIYIRVEGSLRRVGSLTLRAGQQRTLNCNALGCQ
jgi:serine/threonine protein kinase